MTEQDTLQVKQYAWLQACKYIFHPCIQNPVLTDATLIQIAKMKEDNLSYE